MLIATNMDYDNADGLQAIAYNLTTISDMKAGEKPREIMKISGCQNVGHPK